MTDLTNRHGVTAQGISTGVTTNSSAVQPHGTAIPEHVPGRAGWYTAGRPFGHNAATLIPRSEDSVVGQLQAVASPDGTAGGTSSYPNTRGAANPVVDPNVGPNWQAQTSPGETSQVVVSTLSLPSGVHGVAYSQQLAATGGVGAKTFALASGSSLPAALSLSSPGLISAPRARPVSRRSISGPPMRTATSVSGSSA